LMALCCSPLHDPTKQCNKKLYTFDRYLINTSKQKQKSQGQIF
jgi:hypothetical protein